MLKVDIKNYYPEANYTPYLDGNDPIDKPKNATLEVGMLMYDKKNNAIGMILGCIDEDHYGEVRLDSDGMQAIQDLRPATKEDFKIEGLRYKTSTTTKKLLEDLKISV